MVYSLPYSFGPGEVARPQEVNANFNSIVNKLEEINTTKADIDLSNISLDGIDNIKNSSLTKIIGEIITSPIPLNDSGLHLLDGSLISSEGIYSDFCTYIGDLYDEDDSANYFTTESDWQASVTQYGSCGKFVYDSENNTVRLPKISDILQGTTDITALGDLVEAGLPNITGNIVIRYAQGTNSSGALRYNLSTSNGYGSSSGENTTEVSFDASRVNSIYGNSSTVQPQTIKVLYYIVIANSYKTDIQVDIDEIATDLNGKADVDFTNVNDSGASLSAGWAMPSDISNTLIIGTSGTEYTAPANGYFSFIGQNGGSYPKSMELHNINVDICSSAQTGANAGWLRIFVPAKKNDIVRIWYNNLDNGSLKFIYAKGSESEAS